VENRKDLVFENELCRLNVGSDCIVKSLTIKDNGEECLRQDEAIALFSVTQERPYNNEIKLAHPNKRTTYQANSIRREGDRLIVGFELIPYEAVVEVKEAPMYIAFTLKEFIVPQDAYNGLIFTPPPACAFRLIQLPVKNRENFGEWLNVCWDGAAAVNVIGISPYAMIDSERRKGWRIMSADAVRGMKLQGCAAAVIAAPVDRLMDAIAALEEDYNLPRGVESRRNKAAINSSAYWTSDINPQNVDEHIAYARQGGFRMMLIYYTAFTKEDHGYSYCGDYDMHPAYPKGWDDLKAMLDRIRAAGITPGCHFLQTHIGLRSRYVTPEVDHRINLTRHFTLARPLSETDAEIYVEQNPENSVMHPKARYLNFGGEMISYESYTAEPPYRFIGCRRGQYGTNIKTHPAGQIGGIMDISEFGGTSVYLDQNSSLQDEIAEKIAGYYRAGFGFFYFDGSEGTNAPHGVYVPLAQYRVYSKLSPAPLFTEGAAKAHFAWHHLSGGNAFDVFPPEKFKASIDRYPAEEAPRMRQDFTRVNFGWWGYYLPGEDTIGTQPDLLEYGTSHAAAWDCPATIQVSLERFRRHPRTKDNMEVMRRWEDVRQRNWLSESQKRLLREPGREYTLLIDERGEYELVPYTQISCGDRRVRAFVFERKGMRYVAFWHIMGSGKLLLGLEAAAIEVERELGGDRVSVEAVDGGALIPVGARCYLRTKLGTDEIVCAFKEGIMVSSENATC